MKVRLLYFAVLRDIAGTSEAEVEIPEGTRTADLWDQLRKQHRELDAYQRPPMTAVNESYVEADTLLHDGDEVAFIPPVAGG
jgi:molybdopterin converting factor subunit 1